MKTGLFIVGEVEPAIPNESIPMVAASSYGGGQRGGASGIQLDSGPAVAGHWPYMEVRHFINLCNNFIELEAWLKDA